MKRPTIRYGSLCSGIEAVTVAWHPLGGFEPSFFAEFDSFPSAVLTHHWPTVPNLGDITAPDFLDRAAALGDIDVLVGGTPCQSWSVAGLREGRNDPRGMLTFRFIEIVEAAMPAWVLWENVPGIISAEGGAAFCQFLDALTDLGYVLNCDILDAQHFGLAQRRRRVFVACQRADILMLQKTNTSALIGVVMVLEVLQDILAAHTTESGSGRGKSDARCADVSAGLRRKTKCFLAHGDAALQTWLNSLAETCLSAATAPTSSESPPGGGSGTAVNTKANAGTLSSDSSAQGEGGQVKPSLSTLQSLQICLDDLFNLASEYTTSTATDPITNEEILSYAEMLPIIGAFIARSSTSSPHSWKAAQSFSTTLRSLTNYARTANDQVLHDPWVHGRWTTVLQETQRADEIIRRATTSGIDPAEILFEFQGVRRDSAPSREKGQNTAACLDARTTGGGFPGTDGACGGHVVACFGGNNTQGPIEVTPALLAQPGSGYKGDFDSETFAVVKTHRATSADDAEIWRDDQPVAPTLTNRQRDYDDGQTQVLVHTTDGKTADPISANEGKTYSHEGFAFRMHNCVQQGVDTLTRQGIQLEGADASTQKSHPRTILSLLREEIGEEAFTEWGFGILVSFYQEEVLRSALHGTGIRCTPLDEYRLVYYALTRQEIGTERALQQVRSYQRKGCTPLGWGAHEQRSIQLNAYLSKLSQPGASGSGVMQDLWAATKGTGVLRQALSKVQEVGRSDENKGKSTHSGGRVRRLTPTECEFLMGFPRNYTAVLFRGKPAADGPRYKAIGNSMAVNVMRWLGARIATALGEHP